MNDVFAKLALDAYLHGLRYLRDAADRTIQEIEHARNGAAAAKSGWSADPAERKREMKRRIAKRAGKQAHHGIKDKEQWRENVSRAAKEAWAKLTPAERKAKIARITAGRRKAA
jgi:hypothetical protein